MNAKEITLPFEGFALVRWHSFTMSVKGLGFDFGWFPGNPLVGLQINLLEMREDYPEGYDGITVFHLQFLYFVIGLGFNWK